MRVLDDGDWLRIAAGKCGVELTRLVEMVLHAVDCGMGEREAARMSIITELRKLGAYHGWVRRAVENGAIFQITKRTVRNPKTTPGRRPEPEREEKD